ncbi:interleukin 12 receptor, beta 2a, like isoform X1 [Scophthalmus maximus]|uniref:interleukin 12 receptor, beta 2a, like isoform X1 n=1 Tax=Scophthalmus maximus TaxID=52904 RepID=UPI001FA85E9A|nr:interleukin 12 receptor, beta 2a, like isoform X1 [Scophthalmus maximus]
MGPHVMATLRKRWMLSILLVNLPTGFAPEGPPARPSHPECFRPCDEKSCSVDIHCTWNQGSDPQIPTNYSLHCEPKNSEEGYVTNCTSSSNVIHREDFPNYGELRVWVEAKNQHGSARSQENVFNTADIIKPPPPTITLRQQEPLEIEWRSFCGELDLSVGTCDVRNRIAGNQVWLEHEGGFLHTYTLDSSLPGTAFEFQVRCSCSIGLISDWSAIHRIRCEEKAPVGELDVWRDCEISPTSFDCALTWKTLPMSRACGVILGYEVTLFHNDGTPVLLNFSTSEPRDKLLCHEMQCHLTSSLKDVSSVNVSAFNAWGVTVPSHLALPAPGFLHTYTLDSSLPGTAFEFQVLCACSIGLISDWSAIHRIRCEEKGQDKNEQAIALEMNEENLTVSWDLPTPLSPHLKEYVVQYKQAGCPPGQGFDWVKVTKSQTSVFFKGQFKKYTPFQVSLFKVSHRRNVHHLSSSIGYSVEGTPSTVSSFKVLSIAATQVTLFWEPAPLSKQNGVILFYQVGLDKQTVYNASTSPQYENGTCELNHLSPGQEYEVWIQAVTAAGPGARATARFKTKQHENYVGLKRTMLALLFLGICIPALLCCYRVENKVCPQVSSCFYEKVPDPRNSHIFTQMKHQINDPFRGICIPIYEPHPKISVLEVVQIQSGAFKSTPKKTSFSDELTGPKARDGCSRMDCQDEQSEDAVTEECGRTDHRYEREEYSKMVDSEEEEREMEEHRDDCWNSSEDEQLTSGYEKHFMPTALEILEV